MGPWKRRDLIPQKLSFLQYLILPCEIQKFIFLVTLQEPHLHQQKGGLRELPLITRPLAFLWIFKVKMVFILRLNYRLVLSVMHGYFMCFYKTQKDLLVHHHLSVLENVQPNSPSKVWGLLPTSQYAGHVEHRSLKSPRLYLLLLCTWFPLSGFILLSDSSQPLSSLGHFPFFSFPVMLPYHLVHSSFYRLFTPQAYLLAFLTSTEQWWEDRHSALVTCFPSSAGHKWLLK